jgi:putative copper export protein
VALHVLSVSVWIGGQIVVAAMVPLLRSLGADAPRLAAQRFARVAWPFFALAVVTGIWNLFEVDLGDLETSYHVTLGLKLLAVAISAGAAVTHSLTDSPRLRGSTGALGLVAGLAALYMGVLLVT